MAHFVISDKIDLPGKGEDYVVEGYTEDKSHAIACIADGVSRSEESKQGSLIAAQTACRRLKYTFENEELIPDYNSIYAEIVNELNRISASHILLAPKYTQSLFATTLITGFINDSAAQFSFVGNGAIIQMRKEWWDLTDDNLLLLGIINYLNPHILLKDGDTPLYKVLKVDQSIVEWNQMLLLSIAIQLQIQFF
ncbi:MAG: protein phosphatase 2C domain-containing protein [Chitinophagaceae bacterium]|nr:protein phosphatase 2C domain-containing protein [Chitinophagaceae bacterium]